MNAEAENLWRAALAADEAWSAELRRLYGDRAGDARYDERGKSTPTLRDLHERFRAANEAWGEASRSLARR